MKYKIYSDRVKLYWSCLYPKGTFREELEGVREQSPSLPLWNRSKGALVREWAAHNLAYSLGICREKTADCDLEFVPKWYVKLLYGVVGTVALLVIK